MSETTVTPAPNTPTAARVKPKGGGHWYTLSGNPMFEVAKKDGKGMRNTTLADARKLNLLPSVTTILKLLHKEALVNWKIEQAALAVLTAPRGKDEAIDAFVLRVLHTEEQQDEEASIAREKGTAIHDAIESYFNGRPIPEEWAPYVNGPINAILQYGERASSEVIFVGDDYAGTGDLLQDCPDQWLVWDFKTTKKLPDPAKGGAWLEHRLQLSAYAKALQTKLVRAGQGLKPIVCANLYISTETAGQYVICQHDNWEETYAKGFAPLVTHWQWQNGYRPENPNRQEEEAIPEAMATGREDELIQANQVIASLQEDSQERTDSLVRLQVELGKLKTELEAYRNAPAALPTPVVTAAPAAQRPTTLPPAMARTPARPTGPPPPKFTPTPTFPPTTNDGRKLQWDCGVPSTPAPKVDESI